MYKCSFCGAEADVVEGHLVRKCEHTSPVTLDMSVVCVGEGAVQEPKEPSAVGGLSHLGIQLMEALRANSGRK